MYCCLHALLKKKYVYIDVVHWPLLKLKPKRLSHTYLLEKLVGSSSSFAFVQILSPRPLLCLTVSG